MGDQNRKHSSNYLATVSALYSGDGREGEEAMTDPECDERGGLQPPSFGRPYVNGAAAAVPGASPQIPARGGGYSPLTTSYISYNLINGILHPPKRPSPIFM